MSDNHPHSTVSWRDYVDSRLAAMEKAIVLAQRQLEARLEGMNEFREALKDQANANVSKAEYAAALDRILEDIRSLRESRALLEGKASQQSVNQAMMLAVAGLLLSIVSLGLRLLGI